MKCRYLILTPTLGDSPLLDQSVRAVTALDLPIRHVLAAPERRVRELQERYPHSRVVADRGSREGMYGALNAGLAAGGDDWEWFTYINDDDALLPGFARVARRHECRRRPEPVAYGDVALVEEGGRRLTLVTTESRPRRIPALLQEGISPLNQQGMLMHRDVVRTLGGFDVRYRLCADLDFWARAFALGAPFRYYGVTVAEFRLRAGQLSGDTALTRREMSRIVDRHFPAPIGPFHRKVARAGFRLRNLPRYFARWRARGWRTSYQLLQEAPG